MRHQQRNNGNSGGVPLAPPVLSWNNEVLEAATEAGSFGHDRCQCSGTMECSWMILPKLAASATRRAAAAVILRQTSASLVADGSQDEASALDNSIAARRPHVRPNTGQRR